MVGSQRSTPPAGNAAAGGVAPPRLSTTVRLSEVVEAGLRLEASAHSIEAHRVAAALAASGYSLRPLYGSSETAFAAEAHNAFRFRRLYVAPERGIPFLSSSDIISMRPDIDRFLSRTLTKDLDRLLVRKWDVLISCSGTIGNVALAGDTVAGMALSQHAIRLRAPDREMAGFITGFLRSRFGRPQLLQATYGSVIVHIEPEHLTRVAVPDVPAIRRVAIGQAMCEATEARDTANRMLDEAERLLHQHLALPRLTSLIPQRPGPSTNRVAASGLRGRFDAHYHDRLASVAEEAVRSRAQDVTTVGDPRVTREVRPITKFRTRVYVRRGGIPLLSTKQLFQVDPVDVKALAKGAHTKDLPEIALEENFITAARSGTISIGRAQIIPAYMAGWCGSEHATRFIAADGMNPGYLYAWLASEYGQRLITRHSYGSVILEIDREMFASVPIPLPAASIQNEIGDLVLQANALRDEAWRKERAAIEQIETLLAGRPDAAQ